jgi:hypothetical protein
MQSRFSLTFTRSVFALFMTAGFSSAWSQSLGNAGTIEGTVVDPSGAAIPRAAIRIRNAVSGYSQTALTDSNGYFRLNNIPANPYHVEVTASGFADFSSRPQWPWPAGKLRST